MIADVLLEKAVSVVAPDDGIRQIHVFDNGLEFPAVLLGDLAAEDDGNLVRLANGSIGIQQPLSHLVQGSAAGEDEVIAVLDLGEKEPVLTADLFPLPLGEKGSDGGEPFLPAG